MNKNNKGFDWYTSRQRFSIRKFHFGAASILLGVSLVLGTGTKVSASEEILVSPLGQEVVVSEGRSDGLPLSEEVSPETSSIFPVSEDVKEEVVTDQIQPADVLQSEEVQSDPNHPVEEEVLSRQAVISYTVRYIDPTNEVISSETLSIELTTVDQQASYSLVVAPTLPEGYRLVVDQDAQQTVDILEGVENLITFRIEKIDSGSTELTEEVAPSQEFTVSQPSSASVEGKAEETVVVEEAVKTEVSVPISPSLTELSKEFVEPVNERTVHIPYKVVQTDVETGEEKKLGQVGYVSVTTTDEVAKTEVTVTADKLDSGYRLADGQPNVITKVVAENETNILSFAVTRKKDEKDNPLTETTVAASGDAEGTSGFRAIPGENRTAFSGNQNFKNYQGFSREKLLNQITWIDFSDASTISGTGTAPNQADNNKLAPSLRIGTKFKKVIAPGYEVTLEVIGLKPFEATEIYKERIAGTDREQYFNANRKNHVIATGERAEIIAVKQDKTWSQAARQGLNFGEKAVTLQSHKDGGNVGVIFRGSATYLGNSVPINFVLMESEEAKREELVIFTTNGENFELLGELSNNLTLSSYSPVTTGYFHDTNRFENVTFPNNWAARFNAVDYVNVGTPESIATAGQTLSEGSMTIVDGLGTKVFGPVTNRMKSKVSPNEEYSTPIVLTKNASEVGMFITSLGRQSAMIGVMVYDEGDAPASYGEGKHALNLNVADKNPFLGTVMADLDFVPEAIPADAAPWYRDELINQWDEGPIQLLGASNAAKNNNNYTLHHSSNGSYELKLQASANGNPKAHMQGWIDFNNNGIFDEGEASGVVEVTSANTYTLNFTGIPQITDTDLTKLGVRVRIAVDRNDILTPHLTALSGEVEDFQVQLTHPPRGTKKETSASQGETQRATVEFFAYGRNAYESTAAKIDETIPPSIVKEDGQLVQDSELVDGYYVVPGEGRYKITANGKNVDVEFIPEVNFVTKRTDGSIVKQAKGITIRRTGTVVDKAGTAAYTTGWTATTDVHGIANISEQTNTMDGRYIPHVVAVVPSGVDATSSAVQGAVQTGRPTFVPGTISTGAQVPMDPNTTKLLDDGSNPVDATTAYAMVNGVRTAVGEYRISSTDGTVTYTPNDEGKRYIGSLLPVTVQAKDVNGSAATATYTPTITPLSPSAVAATSVGLQGKQQTGRPTFTKGSAIDGVGELVPSSLTLLDASGQPATRVDVPNQGSYVLNPDGSITFTPLPDYYGSPTPVNVRQADSNGSTVVTTYSPIVIEVRPIADPDKTYGLKGAEQTSRSDYFTAGQIDLNGDKVYDPTTEVVALNPASRKLINQQGQEVDSVQVAGEGVYRLNGDGTITFTPEPDFVGLANGVTITIADVNGTKVSTTYVPKVIDVPEDELKETVKRTIRYVYADSREASASVEKVLEYTRTATADPLTGEISYSPWESTDNDFPLVISPVIPNYRASQDKVEKRTDVPAEAVDETITIVYSELDKQLATFTYRVVDGPELAKEQEIGYSSAPITYTTDAKIAEIIARGYELVEDGFANEANKSFDTDTARVQNWDILFRPKTIVTTPDQPKTPGDQVDPSNPDSPRWEEVTKTITRTVSYKLNTVDGPEAPGTSSQTNTVTFERTGTYNFVSNQITYTAWVAKDGDATLEGHPLPDVLGYTATKATANDEEVLPLSTTRNKTVSHLDNNITEIVVYTPDAQLGKISFINVTDPSQEVLVKEIPLTGKTGDKFTVDTAAIIDEFRQQGYEVSDISNYDKEGLFSPDPNSHDEFIYHLTERVVPVDPSNPPTPGTPVDPNNPDGPKWPDSVNGIVTKDEVKRTISYVDEAGAPVSSIFEDTVSFTRTATVNLVTGAVNLGSWEAVNSDKELAGNPLPTIAGYSIKGATSDSLVAEATVTENPRTVEAEAPDIVEVVTYQKDKQEAIIRFVDVTNPQARNELNTITLSGKSSEEIGYDVTPLVNLYEKAGYQVSNKQAYSPAILYDTEKDVTQEFIFELVQKTTTTTPDNPQTPGTPVDPTNPDGPRWEEVTKTITRTVAYKLDTVDGQPAPTTETKTNSVTFERTGSYNHVTKQVTYTDWVAKDGDSTLEGQTLPLVTGYVAVTATRNSQAVSPSATAEAIEARATTDNVDEIVVYKALSSWTITPPPGTDPVPPIPYGNHPTDPTKPADPTPTPAIPKVDGYVPVGPDGNELPKDPDGNYIPPVPTDPTQPTVITYKALEQKAVIQYLEEGSNKVLSPADEVKGKSGEPIDYSTAETIALIEERGYELVQDNFPTNATYDRDTTSPQVYTVVFREKVVTTTPDNPQTPGTPVDPNNPDGPRWEEVTKTITRTVAYKLDTVDGQPAPTTETKTNSVTFERTGSYNHVTKQVTYTDWVAKDGDSTLEGQTLPLVTGYVAVTATRNSQAVSPSATAEAIEASATTDNVDEIVVYKALSSWTITPPPGTDPVPPIPYDNHPTDPTKPADPTPTPAIPKVDGYVPVGPDGNELPKDPDGNYIPPVPTDPTQPTVITYKAVEQKAVIQYLEEGSNKVLSPADEVKGKSGEPIDYSTAETIALIEERGYELVQDNFPTNATYDRDTTSPQVYTVVFREKVVTTTPDNPQTPGTPVDPNNPDGPRWEEVTKTITRTVAYKLDTVDGQPAPTTETKTNSVTFERTGSYNHVTKQVTYTDWVAKDNDSTLEGQALPLVTGYVAVTATRNSQTVTPSATAEAIEASATTDNVDEIVVYKALSSWTITPPPGTDPVPPIPYDNHPTDPTKPADPTPTPAIPKVDGYVPVGPDGNELPKDPDGNYIPPVPTDPTQPTVITYKAVEQKAVIQYLEEGSNKVLSPADEVKGKSGEPIDYSTAETIALIEERGYELVQDNFPTNATFDRDTTSPQVYTVVFREKVVTTTPDNPQTPGTPVDPTNPDGPKWPDGLKESDLNQTVTRTIKYQYEDGSEAQPDVVETLTYKRTATVNLVTKVVTYGNWTSIDDDFDKVDTPAIVGYTPDKASVAAVQDVPATAIDTEVTITYVKDGQKATITYQDENDQQLGGIDEVTGKSGEPINYTTTARITELTNQGYEVVTDGFTKEGGQVFDTDKDTPQTFTVIVKAKVVSITPDTPQTPGTPVDPNNPDGPKWPDGLKESDLNKTVIRTILYKYENETSVLAEDGSPRIVKQVVNFQRTAKVNIVTGSVTYGEWSESKTVPAVDSPVIKGYITDTSVVPALTITANDNDQTITVVYREIGSWIPNIPGQPVTPIPYPNHPTDPTKPGDEVPTLPHFPGFIPVGPDGVTPLPPVDPDDPSKGYELPPIPTDPGVDTPINYVPEAPKSSTVTVKYVDESGKDLLPPIVTEGKVGDSYTSEGKVIKGYLLKEVPSNATGTMVEGGTVVTYVYVPIGSWIPNIPGQPVTPIPYPNHPTDPTKPGDEVPTLPHVPGFIPVGPDGVTPLPPVDPDDPSKGYELPPIPTDPGVDTPISYVPEAPKSTMVTVKYMDESGKDLLPPIVTEGKVGDSYTSEGKVIKGYLLKEVPSNATGTMVEGGTVVTYVYVPIGSWIPNIPGQPVTPIPYPNHPTDPTKPGDEVPTLPHVPGFIPVGPDGVPPLPPVDPDDPSKGYELPPIPTDPGVDTPINYVPEVPKSTTVTVKYVDESGKDLLPPVVTEGKVGDSYTSEGKVIKGYLLKEVPSNGTGTMVEGGTVVTYVYVPIGSWVPNIPGQPVTPIPYPNHPTDPTKPGDEVPTLPHVPGFIPVGPDGVTPLPPVDPDDPSKGYELPPIPTDPGVDTPINYVPEAPKSTTVTVKYVDESGKELIPSTQLEGKVGDSYTSEGKVIKGYLLKEVPSNATGTMVEGGTVVTYVYVPIGSWVPNIPGQPVTPIPYPNHPTDPTKPGNEVPTLPHVPGFIPVGPDGVTPLPPVDPDDPNKGYELPPIPTDPGVDTPINYVPEAPKSTTVTVKYVDESGKELIPSTQLEGKVGDSYTSEGKVIKGYLLKEVPSNATGTMVEGGTVVTYVYVPIGSWVPNIPGQPVTPIPYPNHPTDPTKPRDEVPTLPHVPGFIPVGPDGVTPLRPVDPEDPSKGYELPPIPTDPGVDTPISYVPEAPKSTTVTVKYVDESGKELIPSTQLEGKVGDSYTSEGKVIKGYLLKEVPSNATGTMVEGGTVVTYVYVPIGSWVPNIPGQPVTPIPYPNHPTDPTKPGDEVPTLPHVPGFIPVGPDGVTPLPPVDPDDPSKGYELPPIPTDPGVDTPITYVPEVPKVIAKPSPPKASPIVPSVVQHATKSEALPNTGEVDSSVLSLLGLSMLTATKIGLKKRRVD
ncbi:mucin-binding protein [Streptococcus suis]